MFKLHQEDPFFYSLTFRTISRMQVALTPKSEVQLSADPTLASLKASNRESIEHSSLPSDLTHSVVSGLMRVGKLHRWHSLKVGCNVGSSPFPKINNEEMESSIQDLKVKL